MTDAEKTRALNAAVRQVHGEQTALLRDTHAEIVRLLNEALERVKSTLAGQPSDYQRWQLPQLQREIERAIADLNAGAMATVGNAAGDAWELGRELTDRPLAAGGIRVAAVAPALDTTRLFAMRAFMTDRIKDIGVQAANRINSQLGLVVIGAQTPSDAVTSVTQILGETSRERARVIVKTELGRAYSAAAQMRLEQASQFVTGLKKKWRRSGKKHPRAHHSAAHGQVRDVNKAFNLVGPKGAVTLMYPRDPAAPVGETINCGCVHEPFMASWQQRSTNAA